jgi:hypothetical protein
MSVFTTLVYGDNSNKPIANFTSTSLKDAAYVVNAYLNTLENVDVTKEFVTKKYDSPCYFTNQYPPRADGRHSVPDVSFTYKQEDELTMEYRVHTTIHDHTCECSIHTNRS